MDTSGLPIGFIIIEDDGRELAIKENGSWETVREKMDIVQICVHEDDDVIVYECHTLDDVGHNNAAFTGLWLPFERENDEEEIPVIYEKPKRGRKPKPGHRRSRKPTAYNLFVRDVMVRVKREYPDLSNNERMKRCSELWAVAMDDIKAKYKIAAAAN